MKLCRCNCLLFDIFLPFFVFSESINNDHAQFYWKQRGAADIERSLALERNLQTAKNVILFIGDGLGPNTLTAARIYYDGEDGSLSYENFPYISLLKTYAVDATVPDSASTATALFSGVKTNAEVSGVDSGVKLNDCPKSLRDEHRVSTIASWGQQAGKDTGFVTTTRVTHATPGALYSHSANRKWECDATMPPTASRCKDIARQLVEEEPGKNFKVIMGGGRQCLTWRVKNTTFDPIEPWACLRTDGRDLMEVWQKDKAERKSNFTIVNNTQDLLNIDYERTDYLLGIFANGHMSYEDQRDKSPGGKPSLKEMTEAAIKIMQKNTNGFVLVVEGGLIDLSHHRGHARRALEETVQFSEAVMVAVNMTSEEDTLIVVTSDHSHNLNINGKSNTRNDILGIAMNSAVDGIPFTRLTYATGGLNNYQYDAAGNTVARRDPTIADTTAFEYSQQAGILNDEATHGGVDVPIFARGPMAHFLNGGVREQSYAAYAIAYAARMGPYAHRPVYWHHHYCGVHWPKNSAAEYTPVAAAIFSSILLCVIVWDRTWTRII